MATDLTTLLSNWLNALYSGKVYSNAVGSGTIGVPAICATGRATGQTGAVASVCWYTPAADGSFLVSVNVLVTASTTFSFGAYCTYTDEGNTSRTLSLAGMLLGSGTITSAIVNGNGAVPYHGVPVQIRAKGGTVITLLTAGGTFTTVTYNVEGLIRQVA